MYCAPLIGSYVGSDAVAAAVSTGLSSGDTRMLVDIGTNTEVLLWHCPLYTSDAADELLCVDLGGPRFI